MQSDDFFSVLRNNAGCFRWETYEVREDLNDMLPIRGKIGELHFTPLTAVCFLLTQKRLLIYEDTEAARLLGLDKLQGTNISLASFYTTDKYSSLRVQILKAVGLA